MKTTLYLIRHSGPTIKTNLVMTDNDFQVTNEKYVLSSLAEDKAKSLLELEELQNIDYLISSHYVRAVATAKYISERNNIDLNISSDFGERKVGIEKYEDMPEGYYAKQKDNSIYKIGIGENQIEVRERMTKAVNKLIEQHRGKKIAVVTHSTAISFFLTNWCELIKEEDYYLLKYKNKIITKGKMNSPEVFELNFIDSNLYNIKVLNINNNY